MPGPDEARDRRRRVVRFIDAHLAEPGLRSEVIAAALGMSRRRLYALLASERAGVAAMVRRRRLARARELLTDPAYRDRSIAEIGAAVGLPNPAHFSRVFRGQFDRSPREVRAESRRER